MFTTRLIQATVLVAAFTMVVLAVGYARCGGDPVTAAHQDADTSEWLKQCVGGVK